MAEEKPALEARLAFAETRCDDMKGQRDEAAAAATRLQGQWAAVVEERSDAQVRACASEKAGGWVCP